MERAGEGAGDIRGLNFNPLDEWDGNFLHYRETQTYFSAKVKDSAYLFCVSSFLLSLERIAIEMSLSAIFILFNLLFLNKKKKR